MDSYGLGQAISQAQNVSSEDLANNQKISDMNNSNLTTYLGNLKTAGRQSVEDSQVLEATNAGKIANYALGIKDKVDQYNEFVKGGGTAGIRGSKLLSKWPSAVKSAIAGKMSAVPSIGAPAVASVPSVPSVASASKFQVGPAEKTARGMKEATGEVDDTSDFISNAQRADVKAGVVDITKLSDATKPLSEQVPVKPIDPVKPVDPVKKVGSSLTAIEEPASSIGKTVGRLGGGILSVAGLGDDVYNQLKQKTFWAGENTGDRVGNFMNEAGSTADILGLTTGDPFLVLAGVGLGAIGSVTSEISELFGPDKKHTVAPPPPPKAISQTAGLNLAGQGSVAETGLSTLKQVQAGAS